MKIVLYYPLFGSKKKAYRAQRADIARFVQTSHSDIVAEFTEVKPGLAELRKAAEKARRSDAILAITRIGYLAKNLNFLRALSEGGEVVFLAIDEPHFNPATFNSYLGLARAEAQIRRNRIKDAMAKAKANGAKFGSRRPGAWTKKNEHLRGWRKSIKVAARLKRQRTADAYALLVPMMLEMRDRGESFSSIAIALNDAGHVTTKGAKFSAPTVFKILKRQGGQDDSTREEGMGHPRLDAAAR